MDTLGSTCYRYRYRVEQVYSVVYHIGRYKEFLPWCIDSVVTKETENVLHAKLEVGFPPLKESYTSVVTVKPNKSIHSISHDGWLFEHLENVWEFQPGPTSNSCIVYCGVEFEFRSHLHSQLALLCYDEIVKQMTAAFEKRCIQLYGKSNLPKDATKYIEADMKT
ncbi:coenzyme Q-binding protein COQ10 homolog, mitochondrial-like isoform X2 [Dysidea avara]|uniref:coenzyme Q-binding protein COQ10 homolog, mitochondrial-like isoform X2 n=1 Tax=Dysidea avara TaxID=196820 RepID=UPI00331FEFDB